VAGISALTLTCVSAVSPTPRMLIGQWSIGTPLRAENVAVQERDVFGGA
jgi:hypothetical protein